MIFIVQLYTTGVVAMTMKLTCCDEGYNACACMQVVFEAKPRLGKSLQMALLTYRRGVDYQKMMPAEC